jgi:hypothetical protein
VPCWRVGGCDSSPRIETVLAHESAGAILFDQCGEPWRRAIYLPPKPLPALGVPTQRSQRRRRPVTVGRTAALLLTIAVLGTAIVLEIAHVLGPAITLSSIL